MQYQIDTADITSTIRAILRDDSKCADEGINYPARMLRLRGALRDLEVALPSRVSAAFETANIDAFGYATVLGYLNEHDPLTLLNIEDPVRATIVLGRKATSLCIMRGIKIVKVPAPAHVTQRYAKVTHVNAYPVSILAEVIFGEEE